MQTIKFASRQSFIAFNEKIRFTSKWVIYLETSQPRVIRLVTFNERWILNNLACFPPYFLPWKMIPKAFTKVVCHCVLSSELRAWPLRILPLVFRALISLNVWHTRYRQIFCCLDAFVSISLFFLAFYLFDKGVKTIYFCQTFKQGLFSAMIIQLP